MKISLISRGSAYLQIMRMGARITFIYRADIIFQLAGIILQIYLLKVIWTAIYLHNGNHPQLAGLISYLTLINIQIWIFAPTITDTLQDGVRTGNVALDMVKPINFLGQLIARQAGTSLGRIPYVILALPLAWVAGGLQAPASPATFLFYMLSCGLAYTITTLIGLLMGLISFWTFELVGIQLIYRFVNQLFTGALIPLWLFPPSLHFLALLLPFQTVAFLPVSIYIGQIQGESLLSAFATQIIWILLLYLFVQLTWSRAQKLVIIQGG